MPAISTEKLADREAGKADAKSSEQVAPKENAPDSWRANYAEEMVGRGRIELPTPGFSVLCSTN